MESLPRWEFVFLAAITLFGPLVFRNFLVAKKVVTVRGGGVFTMVYSPLARALNSALKFTIVWIGALALARLEQRWWLTVWVLTPCVVGLGGHFVLCARERIHWLRGAPLSRSGA